tara:strand:+ start:129 stop:1466 length:1338 start_codon:yes stop_codon:yes gene_type:complete
MSTFTQANGTTNIDTVLAEEANRIGSDIHKNTVHTSPWIDLIKKSAFPDEMGYQLTTLVYSSALPTTTDGGGTLAGNTLWTEMGAINGDANVFGTAATDQPLKDGLNDTIGPADGLGYIQFGKEVKNYRLKRAVIESPRINVEDLRFAAHRNDQLRAIMDVMTEATRYTWEERYRDEFDLLADNFVACKSTTENSKLTTGREGTASSSILDNIDVDTVDDGDNVFDVAQSNDQIPEANISNALLDDLYFKLIRAGAGNNAYGRENGRPVFGLVCSSEVSRQLQIEAEFRDDVRYNKARVSELIAPLGVEKSFRGFYHLIDDLAPRFEIGASDYLDRQLPYTVSGGVISPNTAYETAPVELAYIIHPEVFEAQIPNPLSGAGGLSFDPVTYKGDFKWTNIPDAVINPDKTIGFFRGILASASKPIKTKFGYVIAIARKSTTAAKGL